MSPVPFKQALWYWFRLGWVSFGGPAGQISIMYADLVERLRWVPAQRFLHALNYTMVLPGPEAQQLAIYIGWLLHGRWGGIVAGTLFVLPSLLLMVLAGWAYLEFGHLPVVDAMLWGVKPVVVAVIIAAALRIGRRVVKQPWMLAVAAFGFFALAFRLLPFPAIIALAALTGTWVAHRWPGQVDTDPAGESAPVQADRATFSWGGLMRILLAGAGIWAAALALVWWLDGPGGLHVTLSGFFTKVALVTFGGAYAVLPYVFQAAVEQYGWLSAPQMIDGLALGESTPGPLIMVVAFVGYLAAAGPGDFTAGAAAAVTVTFFTFLPSYLFILLGAPLVEATRGDLRLTGPLSGITAAVVGFILNLGWFFSLAVFWPESTGSTDWAALAVTGLALTGLLSGRLGVIAAVFAGAGVGALTLFY